METGTYNPRVMYHATGSTRRVDNAQLEAALLQQEWAFTPFPPPPEAPKPLTVEERLANLEDLVSQHDAVLMKNKKK